MGNDADGEITNHMVIARTKTEKRQLASASKSPRKKIPVGSPFNFVEKKHDRKSIEGRFESKIQTAISGTGNTVKTDTGKIIHRKLIAGPLFQSEKRHRRQTVPC